MAGDKRTAWLQKLDEKCPTKWCCRGGSSWTTARSWTSSSRTLASSTCTSKMSAPRTFAIALRSRWTPRSSGRASRLKASGSGSRVDLRRSPPRRPPQLLQGRAVDQGPAHRAAAVRRQQPRQGARAVRCLRQKAAAGAPDRRLKRRALVTSLQQPERFDGTVLGSTSPPAGSAGMISPS